MRNEPSSSEQGEATLPLDGCGTSGTACMPVDLRLATTYVPAITCLLRSSALVLVVSR
jgi:hypothetical protein